MNILVCTPASILFGGGSNYPGHVFCTGIVPTKPYISLLLGEKGALFRDFKQTIKCEIDGPSLWRDDRAPVLSDFESLCGRRRYSRLPEFI
ncbi:hypothetical protein CDAR_497791 [Caerostris darwini]|uniref:Uncharacterized protein n=1 Tax=Caerostris darwini TaxID=1538125 RepID=A0AAV4PRY6_9ARAC|nr:hypothetical protein CDAR_497791 [Caerostris darwini]